MNRNVGKRGENLVIDTFFKPKLKFPALYFKYLKKFSNFGTLWTKKAISLTDYECTIVDTP